MNFRQLLEHFGFDVDELLETEVGQHEPGQTFHVDAHNISMGATDDVGHLELIVTALSYPEGAPKRMPADRKKKKK